MPHKDQGQPHSILNLGAHIYQVLLSLRSETFNVQTETGIIECHIINNLLAELARAVLGNIGPRSWQYRPSEARSVLPQPQADIPQYSPHARLVRG